MNSEKQVIVWQLIAQMALLLVLYAAASLLTALKFLATDPLAIALPYPQISSLSHILFDLAIMTGFIAAAVSYGLHAASSLLTWTYRGWTLLLVLSVLAGLSGLLEGRHLLELPFLLDALLIVLLILWMILIWQGSQQSEAKLVFLAALFVITLAFALSFIPISNPVQDRVLRVLTVNLRVFVGYSLAALALIYWIKGSASPYISAGILALVGTLVSLISLNALGVISLPAIITFPIMLLGTLLVAQNSVIQGQHWINFGLFLLLIGIGIVSAILMIPSIGQFTQGTVLGDMPFSLFGLAIIAILLGMVSHWLQDTRSYRRLNATSWSFNLTTAGFLGSQLVLLLAGVVQVYLERIMSVGYLDTQSALIPLYILWIIANLIWAAGIALYTNTYLNSGNHLAQATG